MNSFHSHLLKYPPTSFAFHSFVAFVFLLPIVQMTLFNTAIGQDPKNLPFGVVSYDTPNGFADCRPDAYHGCLLDSSYNYSITCKYREHLLKKDFAVVSFTVYSVNFVVKLRLCSIFFCG